MQKFLFALSGAALIGSAAMAAERLTDQQMDKVSAGFNFPSNNIINELSPILTMDVNRSVSINLGCGTSSTCAVASSSIVLPNPTPTSNGLAVFANASLPQIDQVVASFNIANKTINELNPIVTTAITQPVTSSVGCGTTTCSDTTSVLPQLAPSSNASEVISNAPVPQIDKVATAVNSPSNNIINQLSPIITMAINQPITNSFGCITATCTIAITSIVFPNFAFAP